MIGVGIDAGSLLTKIAVLKDDELIGNDVFDTSGWTSAEVEKRLTRLLDSLSIRRSEVCGIVATGSGAELIKCADTQDDNVSSFSAAAAYFVQESEKVIDIGGQSITTAILDEEGTVVNFIKNDKCASGSGRFLEVMSAALGVGIQEIDDMSSRATKIVPISNQCGVFAESEVITYVNSGEAPENIVAGLCEAVANIVAAQARKIGGTGPYTLTGGVVRINRVINRITEKINAAYIPFPFDPMLASAIGAAMLAID